MINLFHITKKEDVIVLDIRDGSIGGMILSLGKENKDIPEKLFSVRKDIPFQKSYNRKHLFYTTSRALFSVADSIFNSGFKLPPKIFCILGPHLHASQVRVVKAKYDRPIPVTNELLKMLVSRDLEHFQNKNNAEGSSGVVFEHKIMQIRLNGYETENPIGKVASEIEVVVFVSTASRGTMDDINKVIGNSLRGSNIEFHSFTFSLFDMIRNMSLDKRGFVIVNVEGEISEISIIRNGAVEDIASFPSGINVLSRKIMERFGVSHDQAVSYLKLFFSNSLEANLVNKMSGIVEEARYHWSELFYQSLKKISYHRLLPDTFYISAELVCKDVFSDFIKKTDVSSLLVMNKRPSVECLELKFFSNLCKNISECPDDLHFLIDAVFIGKLYKHNLIYSRGF